jgi:hypothetical protein
MSVWHVVSAWLIGGAVTLLASIVVALRIAAVLQLVEASRRTRLGKRRALMRRILWELVGLVSLATALGFIGAWVWIGW